MKAQVVAHRPDVISYATGSALREEERAARFYLVLAWIYPFLPLLALYGTWLAGWAMLGHAPRPSLDDPKYIGGAVDVVSPIAAIFLITLVPGMLVGVTVGFFVTAWYVRSRTGSTPRAVLWAVAVVGVYGGCLLLLRWDPLEVLYWFMD